MRVPRMLRLLPGPQLRRRWHMAERIAAAASAHSCHLARLRLSGGDRLRQRKLLQVASRQQLPELLHDVASAGCRRMRESLSDPAQHGIKCVMRHASCVSSMHVFHVAAAHSEHSPPSIYDGRTHTSTEYDSLQDGGIGGL